jgi:glycine hydroxymethyltransferase
MNVIAAKAITFRKAAEPAFRTYAEQILRNARTLAAALLEHGVVLVTGGTDNHMLVIDTVTSFGMDGRQAEEALDSIGITTNKQVIPDDPRPPLRPSGIRVGTPACTTRGMVEEDMRRIAGWMVEALRNRQDTARLTQLSSEVREYCAGFPVPGLSAVTRP